MMKIRKLHSALILLSLATLLHSCTDDDPAEPNVPGSDRDKFVGNWICKETYSGQAPTTFSINIQKHGTDDTLYVYNFNNLGSPYFAVWLVSGNSVTIPSQSITSTLISGSGFYNNGKIDLTYSSDGDQVTAECTR